MSYKIVKEPNGVEAIVIRGWEQGIAPDPYSGMGRMLNVDLETPGEVAAGYPITTSSQSGGTMTIPIHDATQYVAGMANQYFILDSSSQVFKSIPGSLGTWTFLSSGNTTTGASQANQGLAYWKGYLFKFRSTHIDYSFGGTVGWVANWNPATGSTTSSDVIEGFNHYALVAQDDALYFCNGDGVGSIVENDNKTFDPTDITTYTFRAFPTNTNALELPTYEIAQSLAEQGISLLTGGSFNAIYPWDRVSISFGYPIYIGDIFIKRMVTVNTNVYIFPGFQTGRGRIYVTNSTQANLFFKIPDYIFGEQDPYYLWGDAIFHRNNLIFGFLVAKNGATPTTINNGTGLLTSAGVWAIDLETKVFREISDIGGASSGHGNASVLLSPTESIPGMGYIVAWDNVASTSGIGYSGTTSGTGGASYNITTDLIPVGTLFERKTFSQVEFKLRSALQSGESIQIIAGVDGSFSTIGTTNTVGAISDVYTVNFEKAQWLQFQISGTGNSATSGVRLEEIRIR